MSGHSRLSDDQINSMVDVDARGALFTMQRAARDLGSWVSGATIAVTGGLPQ